MVSKLVTCSFNILLNNTYFTGSSLRGLPNMPNGPLPTMSACHSAQNRLFRKTSALYLLMGIIGFVGLGMHYWFVPRFPAYIYSICEEDNPIAMYAAGGE